MMSATHHHGRTAAIAGRRPSGPAVTTTTRSDLVFAATARRDPFAFADPSDKFARPSEAPSGSLSASANDDVSTPLHGCRILVVDDNQDGADSLALMLEIIGAVTAVAYDGEAALGQLTVFNPHVVLLDISLPGMRGDEVAREIRQRQQKNDVVLVAVTGWGRAEDRARSLESGFDYHLVKPVEVQTLQSLLVADPRACQR